MKKQVTLLQTLLIATVSVVLSACTDKVKETSLSAVECPSACNSEGYVFCYQDIANFRETLEVMQSGGDTLAAFETYFAKASPGMNGWISRYNWTPDKLAQRVAKQPKYYASLVNVDRDLKKLEKEISMHYDKMKSLYPAEFVAIPPTYYFIMWGGGGSIELTGNMISMDYFGYNDTLDLSEFEQYGGLFPKGTFPLVRVEDVPQVAVHEMAHLFQTYLQGEIDYVSIYLKEAKNTMLAYAIREGGAEFITELATGLKHPKKHNYGDAHEKELWEKFKPLLNGRPDDHKGWFSGKSDANPDWPWQIGYYVGHKMIEHYYNTAEDKEKALLDIFTAKEEALYQKIADVYDTKFQ